MPIDIYHCKKKSDEKPVQYLAALIPVNKDLKGTEGSEPTAIEKLRDYVEKDTGKNLNLYCCGNDYEMVVELLTGQAEIEKCISDVEIYMTEITDPSKTLEKIYHTETILLDNVKDYFAKHVLSDSAYTIDLGSPVYLNSEFNPFDNFVLNFLSSQLWFLNMAGVPDKRPEFEFDFDKDLSSAPEEVKAVKHSDSTAKIIGLVASSSLSSPLEIASDAAPKVEAVVPKTEVVVPKNDEQNQDPDGALRRFAK